MAEEKNLRLVKKKKRRKFKISPGMQTAILLLLAGIIFYVLLYFVWGC
ncbi:MAG: hypothetical protein H0Z29_05615 [Candidatus Marinimicrobia bacterium]|nr:hypothetical protein [Candidatus Neomarinimicrobiota bacterium]